MPNSIASTIDLKSLKLNNGITIAQQLRTEQKRLLTLLNEELRAWYGSYDPSKYQRTFGMLNSLYAGDYIDIKVNPTKLTMSICFSEAAYGDSLFGGGRINKLQLMNEGYSVKKDVWFKDIEYFGYRHGGHFIEKAIARFNEQNYLGIQIKINYW